MSKSIDKAMVKVTAMEHTKNERVKQLTALKIYYEKKIIAINTELAYVVKQEVFDLDS